MKKVHFVMAALVLMAQALPAWAQLVSEQTYRVTPVCAPGKSLFVKDAVKAANADVLLWTETGVPAQQWTVTLVGNYTILQNVYSGLYLGMSGTGRGATARQITAKASSRWRLTAVDEAAGIYQMKPASGNNLLTAAASAEDGFRPVLAAATDDDTQLWRFEAVEAKETFSTALRDEMIDRYISRFAQTKGTNFRTFSNGSWGESEQLEVILDAYETTGRQDYLKLATDMYNWFNDRVGGTWTGGSYGGYDWFGYDFNDDVMWQIIAVARLAWMTGESKYLTAAKRNFDLIYQRAYMAEWGMMRWAEKTGDRYSTNSCIMGPTEVAACYLGMAGAGEEYFETARDLYAKQRERLANITTGQVYDSFVIDPATGGIARNEKGEERRNNWASTYNQGTMLGAALLLYDHYGTDDYRKDADKIVDYTLRNLCNDDGIIKVCQVNQGDLCGFKGILMRYMRRYVLQLCRPSRAEWLKNNAFRAYNNRNQRGVTTSAWLTKSTLENATVPFSCSTAASAAANSILTSVQKNAFDWLSATDVDYHGGTLMVTLDDTQVLSLRHGTWAACYNVDFGEETAQSIAVKFGRFVTTGTATIEVFLDHMTGAPVATLTATKAQTQGCAFASTQPITGRHHVFLRFGYSATSRANAYQVAAIQFSTQTAEELSGIETVKRGEWPQGKRLVYNMAGQQLSSVRRGLNIVGDKKLLVR